MFNKSKSIFFQEEQINANATVTDKNNKLLYSSVLSSLNWRIGLRLNYGVTLYFGKESNQTELKYTCSLTRLENDHEGNFVFALDRISEVYINEILPDLIADKLAFEAGKVFYPLHLAVDPSGELRGVANGHAIQQRWPSVKDELRSYFQGDFFEDYLQKMEKLIEEEHQIFSALSRTDWFVNVFFQPFYQLRPNEVMARTQFFPNLPMRSMQYNLIEKIVPELNHFGAIELVQQGSLKQEEDFGIDCSGNSEVSYFFHPQTRALLGVNGTWDAKVENTQVPVRMKLFYLAEDGEDFVHDYRVKTNAVDQTNAVLSNDPATGRLSKSNGEKSAWAKLFNL